MDRVYAFGTKGSFLATRNELFFRASAQSSAATLDGERQSVTPLPHARSNPIAYFLDRIRTNQPIEDPLSASLNVIVMEILDAARESLRTGRAAPVH
jgi:predicted dehydrogenase